MAVFKFCLGMLIAFLEFLSCKIILGSVLPIIIAEPYTWKSAALMSLSLGAVSYIFNYFFYYDKIKELGEKRNEQFKEKTENEKNVSVMIILTFILCINTVTIYLVCLF